MNKKIGLLLLVAVLLLVFTPFLGITPIDLRGIFQNDAQRFIFWQLRVPRTILGFFAGAILALSGLVCQNLFKNDLATPDLLGISSGAAAGAVIALKFKLASLISGDGRAICFFLSGGHFRDFIYFHRRQIDKKLFAVYFFDVRCGDQFLLFLHYRYFSIYFRLFGHLFAASLADGRTFRRRLS